MTFTPLNCERRSPDELAPGEWLAVHIFYVADRGPLLTRCVRPLLDTLNGEGLISGHFFVRHWLEGTHLRLRIRPRAGCVDRVREIVDQDVRAFLEREPSVYDPERDFDDDLYKLRFLNEFSQEQWTERYGSGSQMPRNDNDTFDYFEYVPETERYGGPRGVELAEWHAEHSSDLVIRLLDSHNVGVRTVLLGLGIQSMLTMAYAFTDDPRHAARLFAAYSAGWERMFGSEYPRYEQAYQEMADKLGARVRRIHLAVSEESFGGLPEFVREWFEHCTDMRARLAKAADDGSLFHPDTGKPLSSLADGGDETASTSLVLSYMHLMNNRMGITVSTENYLSYVLRRAIEDQFPA